MTNRKQCHSAGARQGAWAWNLPLLTALLMGGMIASHAQTPEEVEAPIVLGPSCVTSDCHQDMAPGPEVHGPLNVGNCEICHGVIDNEHEFTLVRTGPDMCGLCHQLSLSDVIHAPVSEGDCTGCHDPHRSPHDPLLIQGPTEGLCMSCHEEDPVMHSEFLHGPVEAGLCVLCHEAHSSESLHLVRQRGDDLCLLCHGDEFSGLMDSRHVHEPIGDRSCLICHNPHGGASEALTHVPAPEICETCHTDLRDTIAASSFIHGAVTEGASCAECHNPHASEMDHLLREGELEQCLRCHSEDIRAVDDRIIPDIAAILELNEHLHGPVRQGSCTSCHDAHASEFFRLLVHDYPPEFYAPYDSSRYALCFQCHAQESFVDETTATLTNFRDEAARNLHWLHVTRDERGRTCRACHEVHASNRPFHMSDSVPYGGWDLPINFELLNDGGRCSPGCHEPREYHRQAIEITPLQTGLVNSLGQSPTAE